jgi:hypothetical protein
VAQARQGEPGHVGADLPIGYSTAADRAALERIATDRARPTDASDPASIGKVLTSVLSNF